MSVNESEAFCLEVCRNTFLSLWSYANPQGKNAGDELCDILVVCDPDVVIISVKDCTLGDSGDKELDWRRWLKRAVEKSADQIYGAARCLQGRSCVVRNDGEIGLPLPPQDEMRLHRVAIAFGGGGEIPLAPNDFGKGFVHVLDERSFQVLLRELDTITDFADYLVARERFQAQGKTIIAAEEADVLAVYLHNNRSFPDADLLLVEEGSWEQLVQKAQKQAKDKADRVSYLWDDLIEEVSQDALQGKLEFGSTLEEAEVALREMARENRFERRILAAAYLEFLEMSKTEPRARYLQSPSGRTYVFLALQHGTSREIRRDDLQMRCVAAKTKFPDADVIVGIATEQYVQGSGHSLDVAFLRAGAWTDEHHVAAREIQETRGYFRDSTSTERSEDEYPEVGHTGGKP